MLKKFVQTNFTPLISPLTIKDHWILMGLSFFSFFSNLVTG